MTTLNTIEAAGQALAEASHERRLRDLFQHLPIKLDVKNEARVHLWYEDRFGYAIKPYCPAPTRSQPFRPRQPP